MSKEVPGVGESFGDLYVAPISSTGKTPLLSASKVLFNLIRHIQVKLSGKVSNKKLSSLDHLS